MERSVLHLDLDTFFVSCERLQDSRLNGKPVLVGGKSDRGVVAGCSYEARAFGIHSAMPMKQALRLCPQAIVIKGNSRAYGQYSRQVTAIIKAEAALFEKASIDEFYVDTSGMDKYFGTFKWSQALRNRIINETGLPISFGLAANKVVAKIATGESKPNGFQQILPGQELEFLAPLSIKKIPMVGKKTYQLLSNAGIEKIKDIQSKSLKWMVDRMGRHGQALWERARGIDHSAVIPYHERKSISTERTFERDTADTEKLRSLIIAMAEHLAFQMRHAGQTTGCVAVKLRFADFRTVSKQVRISPTSVDKMLIANAVELFQSLYNGRSLLRLIGVRFSHLSHEGHQMSFFDDTRKEKDLLSAMDDIRLKFGKDAVKKVVSMESKNIGRMSSIYSDPNYIKSTKK